MLIVGALLMVVALPVFITGYGRLGTMTTCENFGPCPSGISPTDPGIAFLTEAARLQVIYGVLFTIVATILLVFGAFGSSEGVLNDRSGFRK